MHKLLTSTTKTPDHVSRYTSTAITTIYCSTLSLVYYKKRKKKKEKRKKEKRQRQENE